jgi:prevent-host-death family protein
MVRRVAAREARSQFAEITDRVHYTGEPVIVEKQGQPFVAVVSLSDFEAVERLRREKQVDEFTRLAARLPLRPVRNQANPNPLPP